MDQSEAEPPPRRFSSSLHRPSFLQRQQQQQPALIEEPPSPRRQQRARPRRRGDRSEASYVDSTTTGHDDDDPSDGASSYDDQYYSDSEGEDSYIIEDDSFGMHDGANNTSNYGSSYGDSDDDDEDMSTSALDLLPENESTRRLALKKGKKKQKVAALEHQRVFRARIFVLFLLATTAIGNAMIIYSLSRNQEIKDYDFHYDDLADEFRQTTQENVHAAFTSMDALSTQMSTQVGDDSKTTTTSISATQQQTLDWPFVTFSDFTQLAEDARNITGAMQIIFAPLVRKEDQAIWEAYSADHQKWVLGEEPVDTNYRWRRRRHLQPRHTFNTNNSTAGSSVLQSSSSLSSASISLLSETTNRIHHQPTQQQQQAKELDALDNHNSVHVRYPQQPLDLLPPSKRQLQTQQQETTLIPGRIHPRSAQGEEEERLYYAPVWQMSPTPFYRGIVNHDLLSSTSFQRLSQQVQETRQGVISNQLKDDLVGLFLDPHGVPRNRDTADTDDEEGDDRDSEDYPPMSVLVQPVWRRLFSQTEAAQLSGYLVALIPWEAYLSQTFRAESNETVLAQYDYGEVSSCPPPPGDSTSSDDLSNRQELLNYKVKSGDQVDFLGPGDDFPGHGKFEYSKRRTMDFPLEPSSSEASMVVAESNKTVTNKLWLEEEELFESTNNNTPECGLLRINMYPSDELRDLYMTKYPMYYALLVVLVFVILAAAFFIYNVFVEKRRGRVMAVAEKTGRIVTNLFPTHFADQLISEDKKKDKDAKKKKKKKKVIIEEAPNRRLKKYMKDKNKYHNDINGEKGAAPPNTLGYGDASPDGNAVDGDDSPLFLAQSKPIADLFPETTVLFADIAGFTAWSSVREPSQVFTLLETVYQNFDFLAKQYGIFKIETIGDCYVAVCGLPEPREDHAVAMSRFALACMTKMKSLVSQLEASLGPDTGDLTMRFGLHSGPVTAGVLRGERARFQLFGDTGETDLSKQKGRASCRPIGSHLGGRIGDSRWGLCRQALVVVRGGASIGGPIQRRGSAGGGANGGGTRRYSIGRRKSIGTTRTLSQRHGLTSRTPSQRIVTTESIDDHNIMSRLQSNVTDDNDADSDASGNEHSTAPQDTFSPLTLGENPILRMGAVLSERQQRLVDWNCELIQQLLRQIVARRNFTKHTSNLMTLPFSTINNAMAELGDLPKAGERFLSGANPMPLDEVVEVINLPEFDVAAYHGSADAKQIQLDAVVVQQVRRYVTILASRYRDNPFHNFDHASHVAMSVSKLLSRIVVPDLPSINDRRDNDEIDSSLHLTSAMKDLHDHTYGITSDPLTQLAVVLSALVHDVDHRGVPNNILIEEEPEMAAKYKNKSVAEQNSVDIAWEIFMQPEFKALRDTVCLEYIELRRLRALLVNAVLATDIFDPELKALRQARWDKAFQNYEPEPAEVTPFGGDNGDGANKRPVVQANPNSFAAMGINFGHSSFNNNVRCDVNRKATIVIEHLIQASDVAHTMQHWHIYQKWNECLFKEMYTAFKEGRSAKDPSEGWYKGELWFFDNYVIPLAKKLKECGVFGVSSDEYLTYATANRNEWAEKGEDIVADMLSKYKDVVDRTELGYE